MRSSAHLLHLYILTSVFFISPPRLFANDSLRYSIQHFTDENGLPQNSVKSIAPDKTGFLWLTTEDGIVRFDGYRFIVFNQKNLSLASGRFISIFPVPASHLLYTMTSTKEVVCIEKGKVRVYPYGLRQFYKQYFYKADNNNVPPNNEWLYSHHQELLPENLSLPAGGNNYYLVSKDSVEFYKNYRPLYKTGYSSDEMRFFIIQNRLFHYSERGRFTKIGASGTQAVLLTGDILNNPLYNASDPDLSLIPNIVAGNAFIYLNKHLYLLTWSEEGELKTQLILEGFDMQSNNIRSVYYDPHYKRIFLGSMTKGLFVFSKQQFFVPESGNPGTSEVYYTQAPYSINSVLTGQGEIISPGKKTVTLPGMKEYSDTYSMLIDKTGNIWTKNYRVLAKFNGKTSSLLAKWELPDEITQLYQTKDGDLWIGTRSAGLYKMNILSDTQRAEAFLNGIADVSYIMQEGPDILWIGANKGLYRLHTATKKLESISPFQDMYIRSLYIRAPGEVWITTYSNGFFLYKNGQITRFPPDREDYLSIAHCIVEDNYGNFWISTNKGLFQTTRKNLMDYAETKTSTVFYLYYKKENGFNTNEFNGGCQPCGLLLENGQVSLPSLNGLVWFDPAAVVPEFPDKNIIIDKIEIDNGNMAFGDTLSLPDKFDRLQFNISTPYFGDKYNIQFEYALIKDQDNPAWYRLNYNEPIVLSSLSSGTYQLVVRKICGFNSEYTYKTIWLVIPPAYYEKGWFIILISILFIATILTYNRYRLRYIRQKNQVLAGMIKSHTQDLRDALQALTISESKLRRHTHTQDRLITAITHDIKSPLKYITLAAGRIAMDLQKENVKPALIRNAKLVYDASYRIQLLTENLLQYIKLFSRDGNIICEKINLYDVIEDKVAMFRTIASNQSTTIINDVPQLFYINSHSRLLGIIIHNLLDNAIKVTSREGTVKISSTITDQKIEVAINDTGPGMSAAMVEWCNQPAPESGNVEEDGAENKGFGLLIVKELIVLIKGRLEVRSEERKGTIVKLIFNRISQEM